MMKKLLFILVFTFILSGTSYAAHPLVTDDTGTQGKGKFQLELDGEHSRKSEDGVKGNMTQITPILTYGIVDNVDIILGIPYQRWTMKDVDDRISEDGFSDDSLDLKWRFYENDGWGLALKTGITLPAGDADKGLGTGRVMYRLFFITTKELKPWAFHVNLGYMRNDNSAHDRKNLWHASIAVEVQVVKDLRAVANIGIQRNPDVDDTMHPAFILGGLIYSLSEHLDLDVGIKGGLNRAEDDITYLAGLTWKF
jgi:hypothetical protein